MNSISDPHAGGFTGLVRRTAPALVVASALALFAGCASEPESHVVSAPPPASPVATAPVVVPPQPAQVVVAPATNGAGNTYVVTQAPPAVQTETMGPKPSSAHFWVPGYWTWANNRYEWVAGHWEVPPRNNAVWIAPRTERLSDGSYRFHEGYWQ